MTATGVFSPFDSATDLPAVGTAVETLWLEFKMQLDAPFQAAKTVAAMANAAGGVAIVGAVHDQKKCLVRYASVDLGVAEKGLAEAVAQMCRPSPRYTPVARTAPTGETILVVNIWPHLTGAVVGVKLRTDKKNTGYGDGAWVFPLRVGNQTTYLDPERLPMYMDAKLRRAFVLLGQIPPTHNLRLVAAVTSHGGAHPGEQEGTISEISEETNSFRLGRNHYALDRVESVFLSGERWTVVYRHFGPAHIGS